MKSEGRDVAPPYPSFFRRSRPISFNSWSSFSRFGIEPHEEDTWLGSRVAIGDAVIVPLGDVGRCVVTTCDPDTAVSDLDTLKVLARYRRDGVVEPLPFGVYCNVAVPGRVRVGDAVGLAPLAVQA